MNWAYGLYWICPSCPDASLRSNLILHSDFPSPHPSPSPLDSDAVSSVINAVLALLLADPVETRQNILSRHLSKNPKHSRSLMGSTRFAASEHGAGEERHHDDEDKELHLASYSAVLETGEYVRGVVGSIHWERGSTYAWLVNHSKVLAFRSDKATNTRNLRAVQSNTSCMWMTQRRSG